MNEKFIVTRKDDQSVTMTIRVKQETNKTLEEIVSKTGRSRNEIINLALKYAFDNIEFDEK